MKKTVPWLPGIALPVLLLALAVSLACGDEEEADVEPSPTPFDESGVPLEDRPTIPPEVTYPPPEKVTIAGRELALPDGIGYSLNTSLDGVTRHWFFFSSEVPHGSSYLALDAAGLIAGSTIRPAHLAIFQPVLAIAKYPQPPTESPGSISINGTQVALPPGAEFGEEIGSSRLVWVIEYDPDPLNIGDDLSDFGISRLRVAADGEILKDGVIPEHRALFQPVFDAAAISTQ